MPGPGPASSRTRGRPPDEQAVWSSVLRRRAEVLWLHKRLTCGCQDTTGIHPSHIHAYTHTRLYKGVRSLRPPGVTYSLPLIANHVTYQADSATSLTMIGSHPRTRPTCNHAHWDSPPISILGPNQAFELPCSFTRLEVPKENLVGAHMLIGG